MAYWHVVLVVTARDGTTVGGIIDDFMEVANDTDCPRCGQYDPGAANSLPFIESGRAVQTIEKLSFAKNGRLRCIEVLGQGIIQYPAAKANNLVSQVVYGEDNPSTKPIIMTPILFGNN